MPVTSTTTAMHIDCVVVASNAKQPEKWHDVGRGQIVSADLT